MGGMETLASWVENTGSGLAMTGGQKSYGPGGYFKSPLERVMPISMEMRKEHRKMSVAVVVALDRSGSMSMPHGRRAHQAWISRGPRHGAGAGFAFADG